MKNKIHDFAEASICAAAAVLSLYLGVKYLLPILLPFFISFLLSRAVKSGACFLGKRTKIPKRVLAFVIATLTTFALLYLIYYLGELLISEAGEIIGKLGDALSGGSLAEFFSAMGTRIGKFKLFGIEISEGIKQMAMSAIGKVSSSLADAVAAVISKAPGVVFGFFVGVISLYYFSLDNGKLKNTAAKYLSDRILSKITSGVDIMLRATKKFARAYLTILFITFCELLMGFLLTGVDYALVLAIITAVVDILPVLGVGTVIVPLALWHYFSGKGGVALALLGLMGIIYLVRQLIEPKLVGDAAGVHPLTALVSVWAGWKLIGVGGMILAPLTLNAVSVIIDEKKRVKNVQKCESES